MVEHNCCREHGCQCLRNEYTMNSLRYCRTRSFMFLTHPPWPVSTAVAPRLDPSSLVEEEKTPYYDSSRFYPVSLGQILDGRYQIATKLGYGSSSTVWLARDLHRCFFSPTGQWLILSSNYLSTAGAGLEKNMSPSRSTPLVTALGRTPPQTNSQCLTIFLM